MPEYELLGTVGLESRAFYVFLWTNTRHPASPGIQRNMADLVNYAPAYAGGRIIIQINSKYALVKRDWPLDSRSIAWC